MVKHDQELTCIPLSFADRTGHRPHLLAEVIYRLRLPPPASKANISIPARQHGDLRRKQGYTPAMVVEESRVLQVSIFNTLQNNLRSGFQQGAARFDGGVWQSSPQFASARQFWQEAQPVGALSARARRVGLLGVGHGKTPNSSTSGLKRCV